jgi:DNA-binding transcriptional ArsR family regulator
MPVVHDAAWPRRRGKSCATTLTFHFDRLRMAGLVTVPREGGSMMIYAARFDTMNPASASSLKTAAAATKRLFEERWMPATSAGMTMR